MSGASAPWRELFLELASGDPETAAVLDAAQLVTMPAGQYVFRAGAPCANYVLLLEGCVRVQVIGEGGREATLYRVLPGQSCTLTTCCVLSGDDYPAEGFTESAVRALAISKPAFDAAVESAPAFRRFVFSNLGWRIAEVIERMEEIAFRPIERRLAAYLLTRGDGAGAISATHQDIAVDLGSAREVVSRHLKRLERLGVVELGRSNIVVRDPATLRGLANGTS
jgi:CRP/FNR family transcriptional regulator